MHLERAFMETAIFEEFKRSNVIHYGFAKLDAGISMWSTAISFYIPLSRAVMSEVTTKPTASYFHHYRTINHRIDQVALDLVLLLENQGFMAFPVGASQSLPGKDEYRGVFQHRTAARIAGLGYIGKNGSLITATHGPRVRLGTVLTNYQPKAYNRPIDNRCGACNACVKACPAMALYGKEWSIEQPIETRLDVRACSEHMHRAYQSIGRGVVCGLCQTACPKNGGNL